MAFILTGNEKDAYVDRAPNPNESFILKKMNDDAFVPWLCTLQRFKMGDIVN